MRLLYTRGTPKAHAWDGPIEIDPRTIDTQRYAILLNRAVEAILRANRAEGAGDLLADSPAETDRLFASISIRAGSGSGKRADDFVTDS